MYSIKDLTTKSRLRDSKIKSRRRDSSQVMLEGLAVEPHQENST